MKLIFASDSFKGSLSSAQTAQILERAAREVFNDAARYGELQCASVVVADGGEGTTDAVVQATGGEPIDVDVHGPLMEPVAARYGIFGTDGAIVETAAASGLTRVPQNLRNPLYTTTYGTGELLRDALDRGRRNICLAIGGSATNDGGMGCARALGVRFLDADGRELEGRGEDLERVRDVDASGLDPRIADASIVVMCDVTNPLCGENGATRTFGPQKGATPEIVERLEAGMRNYRDVIRETFGVDPDALRGGGAAGGLGTAATVFLKGTMRSGIDAVLDLVNFDALLEDADLVVTGEGRTDWQSCFGKVMQGIGERARRAGVPAVGLSGSLGKDACAIFEHGIESLATTVDAPMSLDEAMERAEELYYLGAMRMFRVLRAGMTMADRRRLDD